MRAQAAIPRWIALPRHFRLTLLLGSFLLFIAVVMVKRILSRYQDVLAPMGGCEWGEDRVIKSSGGGSAPSPTAWKLMLCGFPGGFMSAMVGISGGVITNPLQQTLAGIPIIED